LEESYLKIISNLKEESKNTKKEKKINYWGNDNVEEEEEKEEKEVVEEKDFELGPEEWIKSERDYEYSELIERVYSFLTKKNPKLQTNDGKVVIKTPEVIRDGAKKSNFLNFKDVCENMNRTQEHLMSFLLSEMGTTGAIDSKGSLIVKGKFSVKDVESLLKKYYIQFVICSSCNKTDTNLLKDSNTRLFSVVCNLCGAEKNVSQIKQGFVHTIKKVKKIN